MGTKKKITILLLILALIALIITQVVFLTKNQTQDKPTNSGIAIMIYDDSASDYIKADGIPKGQYKLNEEKTKCVGGSTVFDYNPENGTIKYSLRTNDECYLYFDISIPTLASYIKESVYVSDGENDLYFHDGTGTYTNASLEAGDYSYRYAGANPNNYVCFKGDNCQDENNLYRIISVTNDEVKLIKYTDDGAMAWDFKADATYTNTWEGSTIEKYLNSNDASYTYYEAVKDDAGVWKVSQTLSKEGYLHKLGAKADLINTTTWSVGGIDDDTRKNKTVKDAYNFELNKSITYDAKIGLMYASDYGYAALPEYWSNALYHYEASSGNDWLFSSGTPWVITRHYDNVSSALRVNRVVAVGYYGVYYSYAVHPSFNLKPSVRITNHDVEGVGSLSTPMIIS